MKPYLKWTAISIGGVVAIANIGVLGHLIRKDSDAMRVPTINIPNGTPYSSYKVEATKEGYKIEYKANDPAILESQKSLSLDKNKKGFFGGGTERRREWRRDQFTMDGTRNLGGIAADGEGKLTAQSAECIAADAGARSQGAMAGSAIAAGVAVPAVASIPYVGWLASGWAMLLGQQAGETIGSEVGSAFNDC